MSQPTDKSAAQTLFLKAFRESPAGPPPDAWPSPGTFRRWLKKENFRKALAAIRDALRFQADIHVATAAAHAAKCLQSTVAATTLNPDSAAQLTTQLKAITDLLRLAHLRQRFPSDPLAAPPHKENEQQPPTRTRNGFTEILDDPERLKSYIELAVLQGDTAYEPFLVGFPEDLQESRRNRGKPPYTPPDSTPPNQNGSIP